ncbi:MAX gene-associated protein-like, partial [Chaetodon auriga]|uniref:MAX gene-associated protein-like n=1 Tax=Chaetodon auriga TaxID=39042 RepID=UPI0040329D10
SVLTFKGVSVTLENNSVWKQFYSCGTEMILTKQGRRMFPYCRYRLAGLDPDRQYSLVLSIVPSDQYRYRWSPSKWEVTGPAEHQAQGLIRAFSHHYSPCRGSEWMGGLVSFYKLKLTNNPQDQDGHIILHSMHRYIPRLHVIPVPDGDVPTPDKPVVMGPESMTFTFPQTEFMAVTTYQNFRITQLKINHNPFAKGFRDDGHNSRLNRPQPVLKSDAQPSALKPAELDENRQEVVDLSTKNHNISLSNEQETRLVLKPIMSTIASKDELYVPCLRGNHALGELVLVQKRPCVEPSEEAHTVSVTPKAQQGFSITPKAISSTPTSLTSTPASSPGYRKRRKRINRHWANSRGREWKAATASPAAVHSPSLTVAMQPELDDVEGLLFVSFTSKEALDVHVRDKPASNSSSATPVTTPMQFERKMEATPQTDEEKITHLEALLLQDLWVFKHRQTIHPVLQEVGLKLSSLDPAKSIDLQYLGIHLPLPPPNLPEQGNVTSPGDEGLPFISRTGKTSDMTKIKGWRNKFIRSKETSPICDGSQKNLSAFCSNMLDEYLESEARYISERADAFSTGPEDSVAYQLPAKSSSYVKTLDSVLK